MSSCLVSSYSTNVNATMYGQSKQSNLSSSKKNQDKLNAFMLKGTSGDAAESDLFKGRNKAQQLPKRVNLNGCSSIQVLMTNEMPEFLQWYKRERTLVVYDQMRKDKSRSSWKRTDSGVSGS